LDTLSQSVTPDVAAELDKPVDHIIQAACPHRLPTDAALRIAAWHSTALDSHTLQAQSDAFYTLIERLTRNCSKRDARLNVWGLVIASGLNLTQGMSESAIAKTIGFTRSALSKRANEWRDELALPEPRGMNKNKGREGRGQLTRSA
jgi:hypothetical protein